MNFLHRYTKFVVAGALTLTAISCQDFLTVLPTDRITEEDYWKTKTDVDNVRAAAYKKFTEANITNRIMFWGELRSDNVTINNYSKTEVLYLQQANLQPTEGMFAWSDFYTGINYCNKVMEKGAAMAESEVDPSFRESELRPYQAEMSALRGLYYFYLVRAFRNVPYVTSSINTDAEAWQYGPVPRTSGEVILGDQIAQIEKYKDYAAINYGVSSENKGRFTKMSINALLADMYLWRGCMLLNHADKERRESVSKQINLTDIPVVTNGDTTGYTLADGTAIDTAYTNAQARICFQKAIDYSTVAMSMLKEQYHLYLRETTSELAKQPYPLLQHRVSNFGTYDLVYNTIFGGKNSTESIFELQFDGSNNINRAPSSYFSEYKGSLSALAVSAAPLLYGNAKSVDPVAGFGKTDFRLWETLNYKENQVMPFSKGIVEGINVANYKDVLEGATGSFRYTDNLSSNFPVYRLSDMMLIQAEAIARLNPKASGEALRTGFNLVNLLYARNNPGLHPSGLDEASRTKFGFNLYDANETELISDRLNVNYCLASGNKSKTALTATDLLQLVYRERQREFVMEGKRWFDLVRQGEASYNALSGVDEIFRSYIAVSSTVRNRLRNLNSLYCPINSGELKVNKYLEQNPVWKVNE